MLICLFIIDRSKSSLSALREDSCRRVAGYTCPTETMCCRSNSFQAAAGLRLSGRKGKDSMRTNIGEAIHEKREEQVGHPLILIIDDSICVRKIVETTLRREGYATMGFADGPTALRCKMCGRWMTARCRLITSI